MHERDDGEEGGDHLAEAEWVVFFWPKGKDCGDDPCPEREGWKVSGGSVNRGGAKDDGEGKQSWVGQKLSH